MNSNEFCFWLEGVVAATDRQRPNDAQWAKILARLDSLSGKTTNTAMDGHLGHLGVAERALFGDNLPLKNIAYCGSPPPSGLPG